MRFKSNQVILSDGDSKLLNKKYFIKQEISHLLRKTQMSLLFLPMQKIFHSFENQHFNFINVGFFLINLKQHY
jgi:hypothetical protein